MVSGFSGYGSEVEKLRCVKFIKCVVFMDWQGMFKLCFILFLPEANPEILLHIGKTVLYDNSSPTWENFSPEVSVKIVEVMCCSNLLFLQLRNYSKWEIKITELV